ncbi:MAG: hypothetical protein Q9166_005805 [cf. Caloplaca sp. 2 TL-2023]
MALADSPWKTAKDSPSRQLLWELARLALDEQQQSIERLDRESKEREAIHKSALAAAIAKHDKVRKDAEAERDRLIQQDEARRQDELRQEDERRHVERRRVIERAEALRRAEQAATQEREAEEARIKAEKDRRHAEAAKAKKDEQEATDRKKAAEEHKAREAALAAAARSTPQTQPVQVTPKQPTTNTSQSTVQDPEREMEHQRYLVIHKSLKELRKSMDQQAKQNPALKGRMGDMRREIRKSMGQLREGKGANVQPLRSIQTTLREALTSFPEPKISLATLVARPIQDAQAPALFVYLLNHLAKAAVSQFIKEAAVSAKSADPVGTIALSIFSKDEYRINGTSLVDILLAKFHVVCPALFGIYGPESTEAGRKRLGWWREEPGGPWISVQSHQDRMTGLGAGYAAISLRNFETSRMSNPYPPYHFWQTLTGILNVPAGHVTDTHFVLVRALLANSEGRFLQQYGDAAMRLMQIAVKEYPKRASKDSVAASLLSNLGNTMKKDKWLYL